MGAQIVRVLGHLLLEFFWYFTARIILPLVSFGFLQVQPLSARNQAAWWWQRPFKRLPSGGIEISVSMASVIGFLAWVIPAVGIVLYYTVG